MQDKITGLIGGLITAAGLETATQPQWANTGTIYAQDGLLTHLSVGYRFNDGYCGFTLSGHAVERAPAGYRDRAGGQQDDPRAIKFHYVEYHDGGYLTRVLDLIRDLLAPYARAATAETAAAALTPAMVTDMHDALAAYDAAADGDSDDAEHAASSDCAALLTRLLAALGHPYTGKDAGR